jgi:AraC family transcriptional regulator
MFIDLAEKRKNLKIGTFSANGVETGYYRTDAGEVDFKFNQLTFGFSLNHVASHQGRYGSDVLRRMPMEPGMGWMVPQGVDGHCTWTDQNDFLIMRLDPSVFYKLGDEFALNPVRLSVQTDDPLLVQLAISLHENFNSADGIDKIHRESVALTLATHVLRNYGGHSSKQAPAMADQRITRAIEVINADPAIEHSLETLANVACMSSFHFARNFKKTVLQTPHQYIMSRRMATARKLLEKTKLPVAEIAYRVGYENTSHFNRVFQKHSGITPGKFRVAH